MNAHARPRRPGVLAFAARHKVEAMVEEFPVAQINEAFEHLEAGRPRYRVVLKM